MSCQPYLNHVETRSRNSGPLCFGVPCPSKTRSVILLVTRCLEILFASVVGFVVVALLVALDRPAGRAFEVGALHGFALPGQGSLDIGQELDQSVVLVEGERDTLRRGASVDGRRNESKQAHLLSGQVLAVLLVVFADADHRLAPELGDGDTAFGRELPTGSRISVEASGGRVGQTHLPELIALVILLLAGRLALLSFL